MQQNSQQNSMSREFVERLRIVMNRLGTRRNAAEIGGVSLDAVIRYLRGENQPGFMVVSRLTEASGISMRWLASGLGEMEIDTKAANNSVRGIPVTGFAESEDTGWYAPQMSSMQLTLDIPDPNAFAITVQGQNLIPEGIQPGFICICSPMLKPVFGDVIHLRRHDGLCALRIFTGEEKDWLVLKSFTDRDDKNRQHVFEDRVKASTISEIAPVIYVRRKM